MDLGGGSGVVSLALLRRYPNLSVVVIDVANVCAAGREIAIENSLEGRIAYRVADFLHDELPSGFDVILNCDAGPNTEAFLGKIWAALNPGGRLVIVDHFAPAKGVAPPSCLFWAFEGSMNNPNAVYATTDEIHARLTRVGLQVLSERILPRGEVRRWSDDWVVIEARK
jgi:SAM-dependent methyltransferase